MTVSSTARQNDTATVRAAIGRLTSAWPTDADLAGVFSRRRVCHFADTPFPSALKHQLKVEGGCSRMTVSPAARRGQRNPRRRSVTALHIGLPQLGRL